MSSLVRPDPEAGRCRPLPRRPGPVVAISHARFGFDEQYPALALAYVVQQAEYGLERYVVLRSVASAACVPDGFLD
jgi:hypothetical protein